MSSLTSPSAPIHRCGLNVSGSWKTSGSRPMHLKNEVRDCRNKSWGTLTNYFRGRWRQQGCTCRSAMAMSSYLICDLVRRTQMTSFDARCGNPGTLINQMTLHAPPCLTCWINRPPAKSFKNEGLKLNKPRPVLESGGCGTRSVGFGF
jgi:hypothetical protein